jgi:hypothetical protein
VQAAAVEDSIVEFQPQVQEVQEAVLQAEVAVTVEL